MIGGFVVGADANIARVVIRAIGPSLTRFGITHPLSDPILEFHNSNGGPVSANDNWQDSQRLEVLATGLAPHGMLENPSLPAGLLAERIPRLCAEKTNKLVSAWLKYIAYTKTREELEPSVSGLSWRDNTAKLTCKNHLKDS